MLVEHSLVAEAAVVPIPHLIKVFFILLSLLRVIKGVEEAKPR